MRKLRIFYLLRGENQSLSKNDPKAKYLVICHSGGGGHTYNALQAVSDELRSKIMVLAIAPSQVIPRDLCGGSANYISKGHDIVPYLGAGLGRGFLLNELMLIHRELIHLEKHKGAPWFDHAFLSPTFEKTLRRDIKEFIKRHGD